MKKSKFEGKLSLKKETVARLNDAQMNEVKGGSIFNDQIFKTTFNIKDLKPIPPCTISIKVINVSVMHH